MRVIFIVGTRRITILLDLSGRLALLRIDPYGLGSDQSQTRRSNGLREAMEGTKEYFGVANSKC